MGGLALAKWTAMPATAVQVVLAVGWAMAATVVQGAMPCSSVVMAVWVVPVVSLATAVRAAMAARQQPLAQGQTRSAALVAVAVRGLWPAGAARAVMPMLRATPAMPVVDPGVKAAIALRSLAWVAVAAKAAAHLRRVLEVSSRLEVRVAMVAQEQQRAMVVQVVMHRPMVIRMDWQPEDKVEMVLVG